MYGTATGKALIGAHKNKASGNTITSLSHLMLALNSLTSRGNAIF